MASRNLVLCGIVQRGFLLFVGSEQRGFSLRIFDDVYTTQLIDYKIKKFDYIFSSNNRYYQFIVRALDRTELMFSSE